MMRIASRSIRRGLVVMGVLSLGVSACRQEKPDTAQQAAVPGTSQATDSSLTRAERIAGYADSVLELERVAAAWAFADPSGESEGAEEREHTTYRRPWSSPSVPWSWTHRMPTHGWSWEMHWRLARTAASAHLTL